MSGQSDQRLKVETSIREIEDSDRYEYTAKLIDTKNHEVLDEFNSLHECYIPGQTGHLTEANARSTMKQIEEDVESGESDAWFDFELNG